MYEVYYHVRCKIFSVREVRNGRKKVIGHTDKIIIRNAQFVVQSEGREHVRATQRKQVHAWVYGIGSSFVNLDTNDGAAPEDIAAFRLVRYNPYEQDTFECENIPIYRAPEVLLQIRNGRPIVTVR